MRFLTLVTAYVIGAAVFAVLALVASAGLLAVTSGLTLEAFLARPGPLALAVLPLIACCLPVAISVAIIASRRLWVFAASGLVAGVIGFLSRFDVSAGFTELLFPLSLCLVAGVVWLSTFWFLTQRIWPPSSTQEPTLTFAATTLVVPDYDSALDFYVGALGFALIEDTDLGSGKRWVVVEAPGGGRLLLAKATNDTQTAAIGNQTGGRVSFFLHTDEFAETHVRFCAVGVEFLEEPRHEPFATVAVFADPFGNKWDLIGPKEA